MSLLIVGDSGTETNSCPWMSEPHQEQNFPVSRFLLDHEKVGKEKNKMRERDPSTLFSPVLENNNSL